VGTRREKTRIGWKERKEGAECAMRRATIEQMWNGCSEMRERERKKRGEIQNEDGREIRNEIWKRRERIGFVSASPNYSPVVARQKHDVQLLYLYFSLIFYFSN
jgi:hypothetical protein